MTENSNLIDDAFDEFTQDARAAVRAPGAAQARGVLAYRRRVRATTLSALAALMVAAPMVTYLQLANGSQAPPVVTADAGSFGSPAMAVSPTAGVAPSAAVSPSPTVSPSQAALVEPITKEQLTAAAVDLPHWSCPTHAVRLKAEPQQSVDRPWVVGLVNATMGPADPSVGIALLRCQSSKGLIGQVIVVKQDAAGRIVTAGQVIATSKSVPRILDVVQSTLGRFTVIVSNGKISQQRSFRWNGQRFAQVDGPTSFPAPPAPSNLSVTVSPATFGAEVDGKWTGTVKFTVKNNGSQPSAGFSLNIDVDADGPCSGCASGRLRIDQSAAAVTPNGWAGGSDFHAPLAPGASATVTVTITMTRANAFFTERNVISGWLILPEDVDNSSTSDRAETEFELG